MVFNVCLGASRQVEGRQISDLNDYPGCGFGGCVAWQTRSGTAEAFSSSYMPSSGSVLFQAGYNMRT